ncbi:MAG: haloalkane dehalogenase [Actinomycetota bacterium]
MTKRSKEIHGLTMAYEEVGEGDPVVFLHGNPTSSHLWRNIIPYLSDVYRCIAPDLIGMGDSDKLPTSGPDSYTFVEHREYLDGLLDALDVGDRVTLVVHDWGSGLGFDWANRHRDRVLGIAYMEAIVQPASWDDWPQAARSMFQGLRSEAGEAMVLDRNLFVERILPASILRDLTEDEMAVYRSPYAEPGESRRPTLTWPRQIPIGGEPADVHEIVASYASWMAANDLPKLFINADPGSILAGRPREFCRTWKNQTEVTVPGIHFIQEDSPDEIGDAIATWRASIG